MSFYTGWPQSGLNLRVNIIPTNDHIDTKKDVSYFYRWTVQALIPKLDLVSQIAALQQRGH